jgi:hypothetical protein
MAMNGWATQIGVNESTAERWRWSWRGGEIA